MSYFKHPQETWSKVKCKRMAARIAQDGMGTKYSFKGYIGDICKIGKIRYNGGTSINGKWYEGEEYPMPKLHKDYEIYNRTCWGWAIRKKIK